MPVLVDRLVLSTLAAACLLLSFFALDATFARVGAAASFTGLLFLMARRNDRRPRRQP